MGIKVILDLSDPEQNQRLRNAIAVEKGVCEITLKRKRDVRSLNQNRWYWACIVGPFYDFLAGQDYDVTSPDDAHEILKAKFLTVSIRDALGDVIATRVRSTADLPSDEFSDYCDKCRVWLGDFFGIPTQDPM